VRVGPGGGYVQSNEGHQAEDDDLEQ